MSTSMSSVVATFKPEYSKDIIFLKNILELLGCEVEVHETQNSIEFTCETHHLKEIADFFSYVRVHLTYHSSRDPK